MNTAALDKAFNMELFDNILPTYGNPRAKVPIWDNGQKMFIFEEHESANGHRYYSGLRFCERMAFVERVGTYHNWTYIDSIELYAFNNREKVLIQKRDYDKVFRNEDFIRRESQAMLQDYIKGIWKTSRTYISEKETEAMARGFIERCYKSFLDKDFNIRLMEIIPLITQK